MISFIEKGNQIEIVRKAEELTENGLPDFNKLLSIPTDSRFPAIITAHGEEMAHKIITALVTSFCAAFNVVRQMSVDQAVQCAYKVLQEAKREHLSVEELTVFFESAKDEKYGKIFDRLDGPTIAGMLAKYLDERWEFMKAYKENKEAETKFVDNSKVLDAKYWRQVGNFTATKSFK